MGSSVPTRPRPAARRADNTARPEETRWSHPQPARRYTAAVAPSPRPAQNRNPHSHRPVARGSLPRGLSYVCRRPKLFMGGDRQLLSAQRRKQTSCLNAGCNSLVIAPASLTDRFMLPPSLLALGGEVQGEVALHPTCFKVVFWSHTRDHEAATNAPATACRSRRTPTNLNNHRRNIRWEF